MSRENLEGMKEAAGDYYRYALEARREYLRLLGKSDKEVAKLYHASLRRILWEWRRGKNKGLVYLLEAIDEDSPQFEGELAARIDNAIKEGAAAGIQFSQMVTMAGLESVGMNKGPMVRAFEWCRKQSVNACYARTHKDGLFLSDRIWRTTKESRATMKAIVQAGIGEDAVKVARALEVYVNQGKTAACLQFPKMMERMKSRVPENLDYNALRLARTELSAAYGEATRAAAEASPAIGRLKWVLSGAHPKEDICDHHAKGGDGHGVYEARSCPIFPAHPNCLCNLQPAPDRPEDFARKMKEWLKDPASHPEVEEWYQKNYKRFDDGRKRDFLATSKQDIIESTERAKVNTLKKEVERLELEQQKKWTVERDRELVGLYNRLDTAKVSAAKKGVILVSGLEKAYSQEDIKAIVTKVKNAPENVRIVWNRFEDKMKILDTNLNTQKEAPYYSQRDLGIRLNALRDRTDPTQKPYKTIFHELGHLIDHFAGKNIFFASRYFKSGIFVDTIKQEAKDYATAVKVKAQTERIKMGLDPKDYRIADAYDAISQELMGIKVTEQREISDIWDGVTKGKARGRYGHKKSYWNDEDSLPAEAMAHMFCATIQNPESVDNIQKYFPKSYDIFLQMLALIAEKGAL